MFTYQLSSLVPYVANASPDAIGVSCGTEQTTWADLDRRCGQLAATLASNGVRRGDRVGIYLHKSTESVVAVHGIARAGAAYVPIDPLAPAETVRSIIDDCGIEVLVSHPPRAKGLSTLTGSGLRAVIGAVAEGFRCCPWDEVAAAEPASPVAGIGTDLAYVMYTSGSTGKPKGIMHTNRSGLTYARMSAELYGLGPHDRMANFSPLHFDMSTFELLAGVSAGATVVPVPEPHLRMPASLTQYLEDQACTTLYTVPSLFLQMMSRGALAERDLSAVRWVISAGEVYPAGPLREFVDLLPQAGFSNVYGPAEVNQCSYYHFGHPLDVAVDPEVPVPLGVASPDAELRLVDDDEGGFDGPGVGKLLVRTETMMAGYWNRPDLSKAGFVDRAGPGGLRQRWYRTGDLVERDADGTLRFLGRADNQVKVRGNRVELEGVEAAVGSLPGVEAAVVGVRSNDSEESAADAVLVVHYVPTDPAAAPIEAAAVRSTLAAVLPSYAIPAHFEPVASFALTPSGKIDRRSARAAIASG